MGVGGGAIGYVVSEYHLVIAHHNGESSASTILSDMSFRFGNSGLAGYSSSIVHVTYHPRGMDRHILLCSVTRHTCSSIPTRKR